METNLVNSLIWVAFALMILVSGGIIYLTTLEWRDRRRQERDKSSKR